MKCLDCPYFAIRYKPKKYIDFGLAVCEKYNLRCDYVSNQQLKRLECKEADNER